MSYRCRNNPQEKLALVTTPNEQQTQPPRKATPEHGEINHAHTAAGVGLEKEHRAGRVNPEGADQAPRPDEIEAVPRRQRQHRKNNGSRRGEGGHRPSSKQCAHN
jgi:hypothetical protein